MQEKLLPYFDERRTPVELLIFHCNAFNLNDFVALMHEYKTSAHYFIAEDGEITSLVPENKRAYHAGKGQWRQNTELNACSIGIELQNKTLGQTPYPSKQISALINLSRNIINRYRILPCNIIGHSDSAPERKPDPGISFPWQKLAKQNIGIWPDKRRRSKEENIAELLARIGYDTSSPQVTQASAYAFCRRFAPQFVTCDLDVNHLVEHPLPDNFDFIKSPEFLRTLQSAALAFPAPK